MRRTLAVLNGRLRLYRGKAPLAKFTKECIWLSDISSTLRDFGGCVELQHNQDQLLSSQCIKVPLAKLSSRSIANTAVEFDASQLQECVELPDPQI
jgi:hypothetical protein